MTIQNQPRKLTGMKALVGGLALLVASGLSGCGNRREIEVDFGTGEKISYKQSRYNPGGKDADGTMFYDLLEVYKNDKFVEEFEVCPSSPLNAKNLIRYTMIRSDGYKNIYQWNSVLLRNEYYSDPKDPTSAVMLKVGKEQMSEAQKRLDNYYQRILQHEEARIRAESKLGEGK